jgi:tetratricopeptide (TPR) repeat protein
VADNSRLDDLRRRVQLDPSSIAFAQLAEEYRRAGQLEEAVDVCRAGLAIHPSYLSARVTLGRALLDLQHFDDAQQELEWVLKGAPENLAAIRGLAEIHHRRGSLVEALAQYRAALALARNDPDLEQTISDLEYQLHPPTPASDEEFPFDQANDELFADIFVDTPAAAPPAEDAGVDHAQVRALRTIAALEQWLQAIAAFNVTRAERHA